jgi:hypothetical protein
MTTTMIKWNCISTTPTPIRNGTQYAEEGILDIHSQEGIDTTDYEVVDNNVKAINGTYLFKLREGTANESHSFIDTVRLAVMYTQGRWHVFVPTSAIHSEHGNVLPLLLYSDDQRTDILPNQEIYLTFTAPTNPHSTYS